MAFSIFFTHAYSEREKKNIPTDLDLFKISSPSTQQYLRNLTNSLLQWSSAGPTEERSKVDQLTNWRKLVSLSVQTPAMKS